MDDKLSRKRPRSGNSSKDSPRRSQSPGKRQGGHKDVKGKRAKAEPQALDKAAEKYLRGDLKMGTKSSFKGLRRTLEETREQMISSAARTAATEVLLPSDAGFIETEGAERTFTLKQSTIKQLVDLNTAKHALDFQLTSFGPYSAKYSRNGRFMLFCGQRGHVATFDCMRSKIGTEMQLQETVHDVQYMHNETLFATAQNKYAYIYDSAGIEIHCLKKHERPYKLDFLPYHFLLTSVGHSGWIKWHDISIGEYVAGYQTGFGPVKVLKHNPTNGVSHVGHSNGVVSLWSPAAGKALVSMFCHKAPLTDVAIDREGRYMATAGLDSLVKIWDLRKYTCLHSYKADHPAASLDISERGLLAMGIGRTVQVLKDAFTSQPTGVTYLKHTIRTPNASLSSGANVTASTRALASNVSVFSVRFRPLEDVLCAGHSHGVSTIIVPGAGEPNFDSFESNPFATSKQRRETEVQSLLHKLSPDMIGLDASFVGTVDKDQQTLHEEQQKLFNVANHTEVAKKEKARKRGRNKISAKLRRKQKNVIDAQTVKLKEKLKKDKEERLGKSEQGQKKALEDAAKLGALRRFQGKKP